MTLPYQLDRIITIQAPRALVFSFFTDNSRWAGWWGKGSTIDPRPGGAVHIVHPGNVEVAGEVLSIEPPASLSFTYGYVKGAPIPTGGSSVIINLEDLGDATRLHLTHQFAAEAQRDEFVQGWRFQLSLFSNAVLNELHGDLDTVIDRWFGMWADADVESRGRTLAAIAAPAVSFRDRFSAVTGADELTTHITAAQRFMPGVVLKRRGPVRHCQGTVLADWDAVGADGASKGTGTNVFQLGSDGRIGSATGFWM